MWPFVLDGPRFLVFFAGFAALVWLLLWWAMQRSVPAATAPLSMTRLAQDPYRIAALRAGPAEVVQVAVVSLVDRGLLRVDGDQRLSIADPGRVDEVTSAVDRALLQACRAGPQPAPLLAFDTGVRAATRVIDDSLAQQGLLLAPPTRRARSRLRLLATLALLGVAGVRVAQTLAAGRSNLLFLGLLTAVALVGVALIGRGRQSPAGRRTLGSLKTLLGGLQRSAGTLAPGQRSRDVALVAAMFGLAALPAAAFAFAGELFPQPTGGASGGSDGFGGGGDGGGGDGDGGGGDSGCGGGGCGGGSSD